jgi:hypothetical protein
MTPAETALGLLRRWYYTLAEQRHGSRATGTSGEAHIGTPAGEGKPDITHLFWRDDTSLFRTLLFNLPQNIINPHGPTLADQTAWADPDQPRLTGDPLYVATVTGVTALLGPDNPAGRIPWMLHAPIPGTPQQVKAADEHIIQPARAQDAHRIVIHKTGRTGKLTAETVRLNPRAHRWPNLERYHRLTLDTLGGKPNQLLQGLANTQTALVPPPKSATAELLLASKSGTTMAPKYQAALTVSYRSPWLTVGQPDNDPIGEVLDVIFANRGILPMLQRAIRHSLAKPDGQLGKDPAQLARVLGDTAELHFLAQIDASVERALSQSAAGSNTWQASIPSWRDAAIAAFDTVMFPYSNTSRYVARIAQARASLR